MRIKMKLGAALLVAVALSSALAKRNASNDACESLSGSADNLKDIDLKMQDCSDAFGDALNSFETEINSLRTPSHLFEASELLKDLEGHGISYQKLFFMRSFRSFESRGNLLQKFIRQKKTHMRNLLEVDVTSHLLQNTAKLMRITKIVCEDKKCAESATKILLKYQDLMRYIASSILDALRNLDSILKRTGYAYRAGLVENDATEAYNEYRTITVKVKEIQMLFEKMVKDTRAIREELISLFKLAANDFGLDSKEQTKELQKFRKQFDLMNEMKQKRIELQTQGFEMNRIVRQLKWKTYIVRQYSQSGFCEGKNKTNLMKICKTFNMQTYKVCDKRNDLNDVIRCRELTKIILGNVNSPIRRFYRKVSRYEKQLTKKKSELDRQLEILRRQSLKQFNHLRQLNIELEQIVDPVMNKIKELNDDEWYYSGEEMRDGKKRKDVSDIEKWYYNVKVKELKSEKKKKDISDKEAQHLVTPLSLAIRSLTLIETQLDQMTFFWGNIQKETREFVKNQNKRISKRNMYMILEEDLLEFGYSWIAIGSVLQESIDFFLFTQESVDMAVMKLYTTDDVKQMMILEAKDSLKVLNRLSYKCREECKDCFNENIELEAR